MTTLVIGARGGVGRHVLDGLVAAGEPVRASVRDPGTAGDLPAGVPVVAADLTRPETLPAALDGVRQVFTYATPSGARAFADAARTAGVEHVVLMSSGSVLLPWTRDNAIAREHREVEEVVAEAGRLTPIRPLLLASTARRWARAIRDEGTVALAYPDGRTAPVHERDVAAVAVAALTGTGGEAVAQILTGPNCCRSARLPRHRHRPAGPRPQSPDLPRVGHHRDRRASTMTIGRTLLTLTSVWSAVGSYLFDWNETHIHNPAWPGHAKFHNAQTMSMGVIVGGTGLCALWGRPWSRDRLRLATGAASAYWVTQLSAVAYPGTRLTDGPGAHRIRGPQPIVSGVALALNALAYGLERRRVRD
jgi:uncharacterized protein YbjT (DUF2867 family)